MEKADEICAELLLYEETSTIYFINAIQIKYRKNEQLSNDEIVRLTKIKNEDIEDINRFAAAVLLNDKNDVLYMFNNFCDTKKEYIILFPIFTIAKKYLEEN